MRYVFSLILICLAFGVYASNMKAETSCSHSHSHAGSEAGKTAMTGGAVRAMLCNRCESKSDECVLCNRAIGYDGVIATFCSSCGSDKECVRCGTWVPYSGTPGRMCGNCAVYNKDNCCKCGKWNGGF